MNEVNSVLNSLLDIADHRLQRAEQGWWAGPQPAYDLTLSLMLLDEVVIGKVAFTDLGSIQARNTDSERGLQIFGVTTLLFSLK